MPGVYTFQLIIFIILPAPMWCCLGSTHLVLSACTPCGVVLSGLMWCCVANTQSELSCQHPFGVVCQHPLGVVCQHPFGVVYQHPLGVVCQHPFGVVYQHPCGVVLSAPTGIVLPAPVGCCLASTYVVLSCQHICGVVLPAPMWCCLSWQHRYGVVLHCSLEFTGIYLLEWMTSWFHVGPLSCYRDLENRSALQSGPHSYIWLFTGLFFYLLSMAGVRKWYEICRCYFASIAITAEKT